MGSLNNRPRYFQLADWADDIAREDTGGAAAEALAAQGKVPTGGSFLPANKTSGGSSMPWAALLTSMMGSGSAGAGTFNQTTQGLLAADAERAKGRVYLGYAAAGTVLVGLGFLAWYKLKK